ncbi:MAG: hypothetical protein ACLQAH_09065 [Limisphaerales bacterium]
MKTNSVVKMAHRASMYRLVGLLVILFLATGPAHEAPASPLAYEGFQYAPPLQLPFMAGGFGWAPGPWTGSSQMVDQPPTLSYPTALPSSGDALLNMAVGEAWRYFNSFLPFNNAANDLWISFQEESTAAAPGAFVDIMPVSGIDIQVNKDGLGAISLNGIAAGFSAGIGKVDFFVLQLVQFGGGVTWVNLFLNPGPTLGPPNASFPIPMVFQANQFYYRSVGGEYLDEIRVGTTAQDVAAAVFVPPTLTAMQSGNSVIVSWPDTGSFTLQTNSNLAVSGGWMAGGYSITTANGTNSVSITQPTGNLFFRLSYP